MARKSADIAGKRAGKAFNKSTYTPAKKKDRRKAREKRREEREKRREEQEQKPPKQPPKPHEIPPDLPPEQPPAQVDVLIEKIREKIREIEEKDIPVFAKKVSEILNREFEDFLSSVDKKSQELVSALENILTDDILNAEMYGSGSDEEATQWGQELHALASHINSQALAEEAEKMSNLEDIVNDEEWVDIPSMNKWAINPYL